MVTCNCCATKREGEGKPLRVMAMLPAEILDKHFKNTEVPFMACSVCDGDTIRLAEEASLKRAAT